MKKLLALILCLLLALSFAACSKSNGPVSSDDTASVADKSEEFARAVGEGKIPEIKFALGDSVDDLREHYNELCEDMEENHESGGHVHTDSDILLNKSEGELSVTYEISTEKYYYEKAKRKNGISVICSLEDAFGFKQGTSRTDVEAALASLTLTALNAGEDELYFVPIAEAIVLRYKNEGKQLDFYFSSNELVAAVLRDTANWTI